MPFVVPFNKCNYLPNLVSCNYLWIFCHRYPSKSFTFRPLDFGLVLFTLFPV